MKRIMKLQEEIESENKDLLILAENVAQKLWDNEEDEVWNDV